jgi:hypothetical protein
MISRPVPAVELTWQPTVRDELSTTWEATEYTTNAVSGFVTIRPHRYIEIGSGLNYLDTTTGSYKPSQDLIELTLDGGAAALQGPAKLYVKANLNSARVITIIVTTQVVLEPSGRKG